MKDETTVAVAATPADRLMKYDTLTVKMTFTEPVLGLVSGNKKVLTERMTPKAPTAAMAQEEADAVPVEEQIEKASTIYPKDEIGMFMWDYQIKGMFKETLAVLIEVGSMTTVSKWAIKGAVGNFVFVTPRRCYFKKPDGSFYQEPDGDMERPLKAETMQGPRICLARSEFINAGASLSFTVKAIKGTNAKSKKMILVDDLKAALEYGAERGFGQWRSAGWGRHTLEVS